MPKTFCYHAMLIGYCCISLIASGCGSDEEESAPAEQSSVESNSGNKGEIGGSDTQNTRASNTEKPKTTPESGKRRPPKKLTLGATGAGSAASNGAANLGSHEARIDDVLHAMKPMQVLLGQWRGTTSKAFQGFKAVDQLNWVWDLKTDKSQPALVMSSDKSPYFRKGRLTYLTDTQQFQLLAQDEDGQQHEYRGTFSADPQDVAGDDNKLQRTFKLKLTEVVTESAKEAWQVIFNQQENNRYLMELYRSRNGGEFFRRDTVGTQRDGTSFAIDDSDYKEKTCIISEGLGTIQVSHNGKSFWVCCTGCKAAFEEEPERWLAKLAERNKKKMEKSE